MAVDDAYITFRYAENLAAGHGLRWNPDSPPCEGYTNLSYVIGVAVLGRLGIPPTAAAVVLAAFGLLLFTWLVWRAVRGAGWLAPAAALPALSVLVAEHTLVHASRGLETVLFGALGALQVTTVARLCAPAPARRRHALAAAACGCALFLTRPDGVLLSSICWVLGAFGLWRQGGRMRLLALAVVGWLVGGALYAAAKLAWFGYLLPNAFYMKSGGLGFAGVAETLAFMRDYWLLLAATVGVAAAVLWRGGRSVVATAPILAVAIAVPWLLYSTKIVHEIGFAHRFAWPLVPVLGLALCRGLAGVGSRFARVPRALGWALIVLPLSVWLLVHAESLQYREERLHGPRPVDPYTASFLRLGQAIRDTGISRELTLYCANAGATPYAARAHHVDPGGLVDDGYCGRTSAEERGRYQTGLSLDIVVWSLFPASPGAATFDADPRAAASTYLNRWCLGLDPGMDAAARAVYARQSAEQRKADLFNYMQFLRNHATLVGEMRNGLQRWRTFVYVWNTSPHYGRLVAQLGKSLDIPLADIDYDGWPR